MLYIIHAEIPFLPDSPLEGRTFNGIITIYQTYRAMPAVPQMSRSIRTELPSRQNTKRGKANGHE